MLHRNYVTKFNKRILIFKAITPTKVLTTQLYFRNDVPPSYEDYVKGRDTQFPASIRTTRSGRKIKFDLVMDYNF